MKVEGGGVLVHLVGCFKSASSTKLRSKSKTEAIIRFILRPPSASPHKSHNSPSSAFSGGITKGLTKYALQMCQYAIVQGQRIVPPFTARRTSSCHPQILVIFPACISVTRVKKNQGKLVHPNGEGKTENLSAGSTGTLAAMSPRNHQLMNIYLSPSALNGRQDAACRPPKSATRTSTGTRTRQSIPLDLLPPSPPLPGE